MKFVGTYDTMPIELASDTYHQQDFAFLRADGLMIICPVGTTTDGASIPRFLWPLIGSPLRGKNKLWSAPHDALYRKCAIIIDAEKMQGITIDSILENWEEMPPEIFVHQTEFTKRFADRTMLQALKCCGVSWLKRRLIYRAVRIFGRGWWSEK